MTIEPLTPSEPVICASPVNGNALPPPPEPVSIVFVYVLPSPFVKVITLLVALEVTNKEPVSILPPNEPVDTVVVVPVPSPTHA